MAACLEKKALETEAEGLIWDYNHLSSRQGVNHGRESSADAERETGAGF